MTTDPTGTPAQELPRPSEPVRRGPPGVLFYAATAIAIVIAIDANTRGDLVMALIAAAIWTILAGVWFARFWIAQAPGRRPMTRQDRFRWLAIPVTLGLVFALTRTDAVKEARFGLSRGALDEMAADVMAGGPLERGWIGLYDVGTVERTANGFWFVLADDGLARIGIAYAPTGEPIESDANYSPLWQAALFEHLDGPWWAFAQSWD